MKLKHRIGLLLSGLLLCFYGVQKHSQYGVFPYLNYHNQPVFPIAVVLIGAVLAALAFLPSGEWVYRFLHRHISRQPRVLRNKNPYQH